jgi:hypothetical protein
MHRNRFKGYFPAVERVDLLDVIRELQANAKDPTTASALFSLGVYVAQHRHRDKQAQAPRREARR